MGASVGRFTMQATVPCERCRVFALQDELCHQCRSARQRQGLCRTLGCVRPAHHGTRCWMCWSAHKKYGAFALRRVTTVQHVLRCGMECGRPARSRGLCATCYKRVANARKCHGAWPAWAMAAETAVPRPRLVRLSQLEHQGVAIA